MNYRSWLVVPAHSEKKLGMAIGAGADAVIIDLADSDLLDKRDVARERAAEWLTAHRSHIVERPAGRWVRISPLESGAEWRRDLVAVMSGAPDGIVLPQADGPEAVRQLAAEMYELEQRGHIPANSTQLIPMVGETPKAALKIGDYIESGHQRLFALGWNADGLAKSLGAVRTHEDEGGWTDVFRFARAQALLAAHAGDVMAIDSAPADLAEDKAVAAAAKSARSDGFSGMIAVRPEQVAAINEAFTPSEEDVREARDIVAAFDANPSAGALQYQGRTIDRPHLRLAKRTLGIVSPAEREQAQAAPILRPA